MNTDQNVTDARFDMPSGTYVIVPLGEDVDGLLTSGGTWNRGSHIAGSAQNMAD